MTILNIRFKNLLAFFFAAAVISCNNNNTEPTKNENAKTDSIAALTADSSQDRFKLPWNMVYMTHKIKSYKAWKPVYLADSIRRKEAGVMLFSSDHTIGDTNSLSLFFFLEDTAKGRKFFSDPGLKEVMTKAGVLGNPDMQYYQALELDTTATANTWVSIQHKVKDYDAWLKVYNAEGKEARAKQGIFDALLCRGKDDPNMVLILSDIKDMKQVKASLESEEKKKFMTTAGVINEPKIIFHEGQTDLQQGY